MKKILSFIILSILIYFPVQASEKAYELNEIKECGENSLCDELYMPKNVPTDGITKDYYEDGSLRYETTYKNGEKDGTESFKFESFKGGDIYIILPPER